MPVVFEARKTTAPPESHRFGKRTEFLPEPQRNLITAYSVDVNVERLTDEMFRFEGRAGADPNEFSLLRT